jgi:hypothetical protein
MRFALQWVMKKEKEQLERNLQAQAQGTRVTAELPPRSSKPAFSSGAQMVSKKDLTQQIAAEDAESENASSLGAGSSVSDSHVEHESKAALMRILDFHSITNHAPHDSLVEALMAWKHEQV